MLPLSDSPLDPDRTLALSYVPARFRPAVEALWRLDCAFANAVAGGREPMIARIKLAWWREALEALDRGAPPAEPVLRDIARNVLAAGVSGAELAAMEEGWAALLTDPPLPLDERRTYAEERGARLFALTARLLGAQPDDRVAAAGRAWALADLARRSADPAEAEAALAGIAEPGQGRWPVRLRPLAMLAALARRDSRLGRPGAERPGSPGRMWRMLRLRLTGL